MYRKILFLALSLSFLLAACGDDSSSSSDDEVKVPKITNVETFDDLEPCAKQLQGRVFFVEDEEIYVVCVDEDWFDVDSSMLADVLSGKLPNTSDSLDGEFVMPENVDSSEVAIIPTVQVDSATVTGYAQKGPFAKGSKVVLYGLDRHLERTKTRYTVTVENDKGAFTINKVSLKSQYALVQVYGFFRSEVSGEQTSGTRTKLSALVDLSAGGTVNVNVNLFTDLEFARAKLLVKKGKFNVPAAKARATKEILAFFGVNAADKMSTDISFSKTDEPSKALYIASVLFLGDLEMGSLWYRLESMERRLALKGNLDSAEFRAELADWASRADSLDGYISIRENYESMGLARAVPDFVTFIRNFWTAEFSLGKCTSSNEMKNAKNENVFSATFGEPYVCSGNRWRRTSQLDVDLGFCFSLKSGTYKERTGEDGKEYFVCKDGAWHSINAADYEFKECTSEREREMVETQSMEYFVCRKGKWLETDAVTYHLGECNAIKSSLVAKLSATAAYVCDWGGISGHWREASEVETEFGVCNHGREDGHVYRTASGGYFRCSDNSWQPSDMETYEMQGAGACTEKKRLSLYKTDSLGSFVCDNEEWRKATDLETEIGVCGGSVKQDAIVASKSGESYICRDETWTIAEPVVVKYGFCTADKQDSVVWTGALLKNGRGKMPDESADGDGAYFRCNNGTWERSDKLHFIYGATCDASYAARYGSRRRSDKGFMDSESNEFIVHKFLGNDTPSDIDKRVYSSMFKIDGEDYSYVLCEDDNWRKIDGWDFIARKFCDESNLGELVQGKGPDGYPSNVYLECRAGGWESIPKWRFENICSAETDGDTLRLATGEKYVCLAFGGKYDWRETFVDSRDGNTYRIVQIGNRTWMADNLNYRYTEPTMDMDSSSWCFKNNPANCKKYGRLYSWSAAIDSTRIASYGISYCGHGTSCTFENGTQGICPDGWHLPSKADFDELSDYVEGKTCNLQAKGYARWSKAVDAYGFSARPAGFYSPQSTTKFAYQDTTVLFWSSLERDVNYAHRLAVTESENTAVSAISKSMAISVRCIKD